MHKALTDRCLQLFLEWHKPGAIGTSKLTLHLNCEGSRYLFGVALQNLGAHEALVGDWRVSAA